MEIKILFVCLGNICRSPMAEGLMQSKIDRNGLSNIVVESAGTSNYHIGELPDQRMRETAKKNGIILTSRARQFVASDFKEYDFIIPMDRSNLKNILDLSTGDEDKKRVKLMRDFDTLAPGSEVPDPYFGGQNGFDEVYDILDRSTEQLLKSIQSGNF